MKQGLRYSEAVATSAMLIGGILLIAVPRSTLSVVQLTILTAALATALTAFLDSVPASGWLSPFRWLSPFSGAAEERTDRPDELALIHARLQGRRSRVKGAAPLPPDVVRLLDPLIRDTLDLLDASDASALSPTSRAVLNTRPPLKPSALLTLPPDPDNVSDVVMRVLDDLERVSAHGRQASASDRLNPIEP